MTAREKLGTTETVETERARRTDTLIQRDIVDQLRADTRVSNYDVDVTVDDGIAILTGEVASYRAKRAAGNDAWTVPGVIDVINNLTVRYEAAEVAVPADVDIASNVESSLAWDPDVDSTDIRVFVSNGIVTLEGTVDTLWSKHVAEDIAWNHIGVVDVVNKLGVSPAENITDKAVAENIVKTIDRDKNVDVENVDVQVTNGEAILSGTVRSIEARKAVYEAAIYTSGIKRVEDNMTVA